jgi:hypothetical protein
VWVVDRDLLDDRAAQREPDKCDQRVADGLDELRRVACERLERPGRRDLALRRADPSVVERRAAELLREGIRASEPSSLIGREASRIARPEPFLPAGTAGLLASRPGNRA